MGARIRAIRRAQDFSFDAFVEETGLGRGYISELERGLVVPTIYALAKVAGALDVTIADLVLGDTARERLFEQLRGVPAAVIAPLMEKAARLSAPYIQKEPETLMVAERVKARHPRGS